MPLVYIFRHCEVLNPQLFETRKQSNEGEFEEEEEEEEELRGVARGYMFSIEREEFSSRLWPLALLVQVAWKKAITLRREIAKGLGSGQFL